MEGASACSQLDWKRTGRRDACLTPWERRDCVRRVPVLCVSGGG